MSRVPKIIKERKGGIADKWGQSRSPSAVRPERTTGHTPGYVTYARARATQGGVGEEPEPARPLEQPGPQLDTPSGRRRPRYYSKCEPAAQTVEFIPGIQESPGFNPQRHINQVCLCKPIISTPQESRGRGIKSSVVLSYIVIQD